MMSRADYIKAHPECMPHADTGHWELNGDEFGEDYEIIDHIRDYLWDGLDSSDVYDYIEANYSKSSLIDVICNNEGIDWYSDRECEYVDQEMESESCPEEGEDFYSSILDETFIWVWDPLEEEEESTEPPTPSPDTASADPTPVQEPTPAPAGSA